MNNALAMIALLLLGVAGCDSRESASAAATSPTTAPSAPSTAPAPPGVADLAKDYKRLQAMTKEPVFVDQELAQLCRGISVRDVTRARETKGPHANTRVMIYMNESAAAAYRQSQPTYPVGAVIIKEKTGMRYWGDSGDQKVTPNGVGGMIKRAPGYDKMNGDWEYFYFEDPAKIESGKIASCVQCHAGAMKKDHVFGNWAKGRD